MRFFRYDTMAKQYDLEERTAVFGEDVIAFACSFPRNSVTDPLISQLVRAGTSVGANYLEANDSLSKKDFVYRLGISRRESKETGHWLRMISRACRVDIEERDRLSGESIELNKIFSSIIRKST